MANTKMINTDAVKTRVKGAQKKALAKFLKQAKKTTEIAAEKFLTGSIAFTKKQLTFLQSLEKTVQTKTKKTRTRRDD